MTEQTPAPTTDQAKPNAHCDECGAAYHAKRKDVSDFCSQKCRAAFNNRRAMRGAEMYDLVMALRFDREKATELGVWKVICRVAAEHHEQDQRERGGRRSWRGAKSVIARRPYLMALTRISLGGKGKK